MLTGTLLLATRSKRITEINIDGIIGIPEEGRDENPADRNEAYEKFQRQLEAIRNISTPEIVVNIRSTGGSVDDALLIHDLLRGSGKKVTTRCYGYVASAATLIAQSASKGLREMSANGLYLIHRSVCCGAGNADALEQTADLLNQTDQRIAALYAARAGKPSDHFTRLMGFNQGNGKWLCAQEAKKAGLIDRIIPAQTISNEARQAIRTLNLPSIPQIPTENDSTSTVQRMLKRCLAAIGWSPGNQGQEIIITVKPSAENTEPATRPEKPDPESHPAISARINPDNNPDKNISNDPPLRLKALATSTEAKEDPSKDEPLISPNARAYQQDIHHITL